MIKQVYVNLVIFCLFLKIWQKKNESVLIMIYPDLRVGWKVHMIISYLLLMTFLINGIQALQRYWKKCMNHKGDYIEK